MDNKLKKVSLIGHGYSGIEVHYDSPVSRGGIDVLTFNYTKDPLATPTDIISQMQRMKFYFMLLFSMITQDDEKFLSDSCDSILDANDNIDVDRFTDIVSVSQRVFVTRLEIDEYNKIIISCDYEMIEERVKSYSTVKFGPDDEFPRYNDAIIVAREILGHVGKYVFSEKDSSVLLSDVKDILLKLMPDRGDEIRDMDESQRRDLYRDYLENRGYVVISEDDMSDTPVDEDAMVTGSHAHDNSAKTDQSDDKISEIPDSGEVDQMVEAESFD